MGPAAPFMLTPLVKEVLAELVRAEKPLASHEVAQHTGSRHDHVVKALMRMHRGGWVNCEQTRREVGPTFTGYILNEKHREQAKIIVEKAA